MHFEHARLSQIRIRATFLVGKKYHFRSIITTIYTVFLSIFFFRSPLRSLAGWAAGMRRTRLGGSCRRPGASPGCTQI